ncbi:MAG: hypothetical protein JNM70_21060 [Anaerolineae bacterium]|nr:hypothetical protein [Anaerolineae bacterium]
MSPAPGLPVDETLLKAMEHKLSDLAALWRSHRATPEAETITRQYQAVLRCMIELGFRAPLDVDSELPNRLMPAEYVDLFKSR